MYKYYNNFTGGEKMKNQKFLIVVNLLAAIAFIIASVMWFVMGKTTAGVIMAIGAVLFIVSTYVQIKIQSKM